LKKFWPVRMPEADNRRTGIHEFAAASVHAIRDHLEHSALRVHITGESYRGVKARRLASNTKDG
jgi:hypothetical protein